MERGTRNPRSEQLCDVVDHNVQFAVVADIEQMARPAFIAAKCGVPFKIEEDTCSDASNPDELVVKRALVDA